MTLRTTPAVPSGRSVTERPPRSAKVYISLRDDVGGLADTAGVERGVLEDGQLEVGVAGPVGLADEGVADGDELGPDVLGNALGCGEAA